MLTLYHSSQSWRIYFVPGMTSSIHTHIYTEGSFKQHIPMLTSKVKEKKKTQRANKIKKSSKKKKWSLIEV